MMSDNPSLRVVMRDAKRLGADVWRQDGDVCFRHSAVWNGKRVLQNSRRKDAAMVVKKWFLDLRNS